MAKYLFMDGVDDYLQLPTMTLDAVEIDGVIENPKSTFYRQGSYYVHLNGWGATAGTVFTVNEVLTTPANVPLSIRQTMKANHSSPISSNLPVYSYGGTSTFQKGRIHSIKIYNGSTLVASYDMSTGTVLDQSGNGRNATLFGGTWMDDGSSSGTAYTKSLSDNVSTSESFAKRFSGFKSLSDTIPTSDSISKRFSATVIDGISTGDSENERTNKQLTDAITGADSLALTKGKAVNIADSVAITDAISKALSKLRTDSIAGTDAEREATVKRFADSLSLSDQLIKTGGKSVMLSDYVLTGDSLSKSTFKTRTEAISLEDSIGKKSSVNVRLYDVVISTDSLEAFVPDVPAYREVIRIPLNISIGQTLTLSITQRETIELKL